MTADYERGYRAGLERAAQEHVMNAVRQYGSRLTNDEIRALLGATDQRGAGDEERDTGRGHTEVQDTLQSASHQQPERQPPVTPALQEGAERRMDSVHETPEAARSDQPASEGTSLTEQLAQFLDGSASWASSVTKLGDSNPDAIVLRQSAERLRSLEHALAKCEAALRVAIHPAPNTLPDYVAAAREALAAIAELKEGK